MLCISYHTELGAVLLLILYIFKHWLSVVYCPVPEPSPYYHSHDYKWSQLATNNYRGSNAASALCSEHERIRYIVYRACIGVVYKLLCKCSVYTTPMHARYKLVSSCQLGPFLIMWMIINCYVANFQCEQLVAAKGRNCKSTFFVSCEIQCQSSSCFAFCLFRSYILCHSPFWMHRK